MADWVLGVLGGSGLYDIPGVEGAWERVETVWGAPSDDIFRGRLNGIEVAFLPRHGRGHKLSPTNIDYRANIAALKSIGVTDIISFSACGSFREELSPGTFVLIDQYVDRTFAREKTFFGPGCVAHVSMAHPICARLAGLAAEAAKKAGARVSEGGAYLAMEGPQFSSLAESKLYKSWGMDVIGMTGMPEAKLAREAELPYACVAMVTDYDCWHEEVGPVSVADVLKVLHDNADAAKATLSHLTQALAQRPREASPIDTALDFALITAPGARDAEFCAKLDVIAGRALRA